MTRNASVTNASLLFLVYSVSVSGNRNAFHMLPSYLKRRSGGENGKSKKPKVSRHGTGMYCVFLILGRIGKVEEASNILEESIDLI